MTSQPNPADFSVNDRPREYVVRINVEGVIRRTIKANSQEEADALAEKIGDDIAAERETVELDEVDEARVAYCGRAHPMYRVTRNGEKYQVSRLEPGDLPREPDERGF